MMAPSILRPTGHRIAELFGKIGKRRRGPCGSRHFITPCQGTFGPDSAKPT